MWSIEEVGLGALLFGASALYLLSAKNPEAAKQPVAIEMPKIKSGGLSPIVATGLIVGVLVIGTLALDTVAQKNKDKR